MAFENIVRPFQTRDVSPPQRLAAAPDAADTAIVTLAIGRGGSGKTMSGSYSSSITVYQKKHAVENKNAEPRNAEPRNYP